MTSIAEREAESIKTAFERINYDEGEVEEEVQIAYEKGRTAKPCKEQIDAVAKYLADTCDGWNNLSNDDRKPYIDTALEILEVARHAVIADEEDAQ